MIAAPLRYGRVSELPEGFTLDRESPARPLALRPTALVYGAAASAAVAAGEALPLAGSAVSFAACEAFLPSGDGVVIAHAGLGRLRRWAESGGKGLATRIEAVLARLSAPRPPFAGLSLDRPRIVGIVNATPDSFYAESRSADADAAAARARAQLAEGAAMIDLGGESTRPGAADTAEDVERARVLPALAALAGLGVPVSVDTRKAAVMAAALDAGAAAINDVSALEDDPAALALVAARGAPVVIGHKPGSPAEMSAHAAYGHIAYEVYAYLARRVAACEAAGVERARIAVDPGFGFGKTSGHNAALLGDLALFHGLGCAVMVGASRKRFIPGARDAGAGARLPTSLAAAVLAAAAGAQLVRVHDVADTRAALEAWAASAALG